MPSAGKGRDVEDSLPCLQNCGSCCCDKVREPQYTTAGAIAVVMEGTLVCSCSAVGIMLCSVPIESSLAAGSGSLLLGAAALHCSASVFHWYSRWQHLHQRRHTDTAAQSASRVISVAPLAPSSRDSASASKPSIAVAMCRDVSSEVAKDLIPSNVAPEMAKAQRVRDIAHEITKDHAGPVLLPPHCCNGIWFSAAHDGAGTCSSAVPSDAPQSDIGTGMVLSASDNVPKQSDGETVAFSACEKKSHLMSATANADSSVTAAESVPEQCAKGSADVVTCKQPAGTSDSCEQTNSSGMCVEKDNSNPIEHESGINDISIEPSMHAVDSTDQQKADHLLNERPNNRHVMGKIVNNLETDAAVTPLPLKQDHSDQQRELEIEEPCEAKDDTDTWWSGTIIGKNADGTYDVKLNSHDTTLYKVCSVNLRSKAWYAAGEMRDTKDENGKCRPEFLTTKNIEGTYAVTLRDGLNTLWPSVCGTNIRESAESSSEQRKAPHELSENQPLPNQCNDSDVQGGSRSEAELDAAPGMQVEAYSDFLADEYGVDYLSLRKGDLVVVLRQQAEPDSTGRRWLYGMVNGRGPGWFPADCAFREDVGESVLSTTDPVEIKQHERIEHLAKEIADLKARLKQTGNDKAAVRPSVEPSAPPAAAPNANEIKARLAQMAASDPAVAAQLRQKLQAANCGFREDVGEGVESTAASEDAKQDERIEQMVKEIADLRARLKQAGNDKAAVRPNAEPSAPPAAAPNANEIKARLAQMAAGDPAVAARLRQKLLATAQHAADTAAGVAPGVKLEASWEVPASDKCPINADAAVSAEETQEFSRDVPSTLPVPTRGEPAAQPSACLLGKSNTKRPFGPSSPEFEFTVRAEVVNRLHKLAAENEELRAQVREHAREIEAKESAVKHAKEEAEAARTELKRARSAAAGIGCAAKDAPKLNLRWSETCDWPGGAASAQGLQKLRHTIDGQNAKLTISPPPADWRTWLQLGLRRNQPTDPVFLKLLVSNVRVVTATAAGHLDDTKMAGEDVSYLGLLWAAPAIS